MKLFDIEKYLLIVLLFSLTACSAVGTRFQLAAPPNVESSLVYIYRASSWKNMLISPGVLIDGEEKFLIQNGGYSFFYLKPGVHTFTLKLSDRWEGLAQVQVNTEPTQSYYLKVDTGFGPELFVRNFRIVKVADPIGQDEIKECGYLDPAQSKRFSKRYVLEDN